MITIVKDIHHAQNPDKTRQQPGPGDRKAYFGLLGVDTDTLFDVSTDGQVLIFSPVKDTDDREAFKAALDKVNAKYPKALKKLAE